MLFLQPHHSDHASAKISMSFIEFKWLFSLQPCKVLCLPSILWYPIDRLAVVFDIFNMVSWWCWWYGLLE